MCLFSVQSYASFCHWCSRSPNFTPSFLLIVVLLLAVMVTVRFVTEGRQVPDATFGMAGGKVQDWLVQQWGSKERSQYIQCAMMDLFLIMPLYNHLLAVLLDRAAMTVANTWDQQQRENENEKEEEHPSNPQPKGQESSTTKDQASNNTGVKNDEASSNGERSSSLKHARSSSIRKLNSFLNNNREVKKPHHYQHCPDFYFLYGWFYHVIAGLSTVGSILIRPLLGNQSSATSSSLLQLFRNQSIFLPWYTTWLCDFIETTLWLYVCCAIQQRQEQQPPPETDIPGGRTTPNWTLLFQAAQMANIAKYSSIAFWLLLCLCFKVQSSMMAARHLSNSKNKQKINMTRKEQKQD